MSPPAPHVSFSSLTDLSTNFESILNKLDDAFASWSADFESFQFSYDGVNFDIRKVSHEGRQRFLINATIGYMPYTIESVERREAIKAIITGSRTLPNVKFGVSVEGKITAGAISETPRIVSPDTVFYPLMLFLQEARPFITLIGQYLSAPAKASIQQVPNEGNSPRKTG